MNYKKFSNLFLTVIFILTLSGCGHVSEFGKKFWGSSTERLNIERKNAVSKTFRCTFDECFDKVLELTHAPKIDTEVYSEKSPDSMRVSTDTMTSTDVMNTSSPGTTAVKRDYMELFLQDRRKMVIVVMGVPGAVDTTEVGIFFVPVEKNIVRLEFSSLSTPAKVKAADLAFAKLAEFFPEVKK